MSKAKGGNKQKKNDPVVGNELNEVELKALENK
jgi:hypothetical protein